MQTQLLDVLKFNESYVCRVEYHMRAPMHAVLRSNEQPIRNVKNDLYNNLDLRQLCKVKLEYHSHRKHVLTRHAKNVLFTSDGKQYWSAFNADFKPDERDWIIFKMMQQTAKIQSVKKIVFKNYKSNQDVKEMMVYIGDVRTKQWHRLTTDVIQPQSSKELQYFDVQQFDPKWIDQEQ
eukprot:CAMPEP_0202719802 /NCGR_PEP_ID=MMETSP1385-20130828/134649_1 /ASSEMBLY_ACC=CAM_ASM_000861 /TAXON_ID=933848 /ORGANISM="Elphidium margaritaceum" /LENGTH=177 /DNA_ID=CAMNT_0049383167 /DNA_START=94 /DNA_END=624 /DNA_ORIENTATION=-